MHVRVTVVDLLDQIGQTLMDPLYCGGLLIHGDIVRQNALFMNEVGKTRANLRHQFCFYRVRMTVIRISVQTVPRDCVAEVYLPAAQLLDELL